MNAGVTRRKSAGTQGIQTAPSAPHGGPDSARRGWDRYMGVSRLVSPRGSTTRASVQCGGRQPAGTGKRDRMDRMTLRCGVKRGRFGVNEPMSGTSGPPEAPVGAQAAYPESTGCCSPPDPPGPGVRRVMRGVRAQGIGRREGGERGGPYTKRGVVAQDGHGRRPDRSARAPLEGAPTRRPRSCSRPPGRAP